MPGKPAARQTDQVKAVDVHIVAVPAPPAPPIPTPLPHMFSGMLDASLSTDVKIGGQFAATVDSIAHNLPPHIPTPPGVSFLIPPKNQGKVFMGSMTVLINGKPAARMGDQVMTCNDPTDLPIGTIVSGFATVMIGGPPAPAGPKGAGGGGSAATKGGSADTADTEEGKASTGSYGAGADTIKDDHFWEVLVQDPTGAPVSGRKYELRLPGDKHEHGTLPGSGKLHKDGQHAGEGTILFEGLHAASWKETTVENHTVVHARVDCAAMPEGTSIQFKIFREYHEAAADVVATPTGPNHHGVAHAQWTTKLDPILDRGTRARYVFHATASGRMTVSTALVVCDQLKLCVKDGQGRPVPSLGLIAVGEDGLESSVRTDAQGMATFTGLAVGICALRPERSGQVDSDNAPPPPTPRVDTLHVVSQGEWVSQIAARYGFANFRTIYDDARNEALRTLRPNPNELYPGDEVWVPGGRHELLLPSRAMEDKTWNVKFTGSEPEQVILIVRNADGQPVRSTAYVLTIGGFEKPGTTDGDGRLVENIDVSLLEFTTPTLTIAGQVMNLQIGHLDPLNTISGAQGRLKNLGHSIPAINGRLNQATRLALFQFQQEQHLPTDGLPNEETLRKLDQVHRGEA